jgi:hypothetical protein
MGFLQDLFGIVPCPADKRQEVNQLINELVTIGKRDDFLSERPGSPFNAQCRHTRARQIGTRLNEIGGMTLLEYTQRQIAKKNSKEIAAHLSYCWTEIGDWIP